MGYFLEIVLGNLIWYDSFVVMICRIWVTSLVSNFCLKSTEKCHSGFSLSFLPPKSNGNISNEQSRQGESCTTEMEKILITVPTDIVTSLSPVSNLKTLAMILHTGKTKLSV